MGCKKDYKFFIYSVVRNKCLFKRSSFEIKCFLNLNSGARVSYIDYLVTRYLMKYSLGYIFQFDKVTHISTRSRLRKLFKLYPIKENENL